VLARPHPGGVDDAPYDLGATPDLEVVFKILLYLRSNTLGKRVTALGADAAKVENAVVVEDGNERILVVNDMHSDHLGLDHSARGIESASYRD
jgi:hypothetical protein